MHLKEERWNFIPLKKKKTSVVVAMKRYGSEQIRATLEFASKKKFDEAFFSCSKVCLERRMLKPISLRAAASSSLIKWWIHLFTPAQPNMCLRWSCNLQWKSGKNYLGFALFCYSKNKRKTPVPFLCGMCEFSERFGGRRLKDMIA